MFTFSHCHEVTRTWITGQDTMVCVNHASHEPAKEVQVYQKEVEIAPQLNGYFLSVGEEHVCLRDHHLPQQSLSGLLSLIQYSRLVGCPKY